VFFFEQLPVIFAKTGRFLWGLPGILTCFREGVDAVLLLGSAPCEVYVVPYLEARIPRILGGGTQAGGYPGLFLRGSALGSGFLLSFLIPAPACGFLFGVGEKRLHSGFF
jgi:hypothetical protein